MLVPEMPAAQFRSRLQKTWPWRSRPAGYAGGADAVRRGAGPSNVWGMFLHAYESHFPRAFNGR